MRCTDLIAAFLLAVPAAGAQSALRPVALAPARDTATGWVVSPDAHPVWHAAEKGMFWGGLGGAVIGGVWGFASYSEKDNQGCEFFCPTRGGQTAIGAIALGAVGLVAGGVTGFIVGNSHKASDERRVAVVATSARAGLQVAF